MSRLSGLTQLSVGLISLLLALTAAPAAYAEDSVSLVEGTRALYRGNFDRALSLAEAYLKAHPQSSAARILLARAQISKGQYDSAFNGLARLVQAEPKNIDAIYYLGRISRILSQHELLRLLAEAPDSARAHQTLGQAFEAQDNDARAEEEYKVALKADPQSLELLNALGDVERHQYKFDEAIAYYSRVAEARPRDYASNYGRGAVYLLKQQPEQAVPFFQQAVATDPDSAVAHFALGDSLLRLGRTEKAVDQLRTAAALESQMRQAYALLAQAYRKLGRAEEAAAALKKSQELDQMKVESEQIPSTKPEGN